MSAGGLAPERGRPDVAGGDRRLHVVHVVLVSLWAVGSAVFLIIDGLPTNKALVLAWLVAGLGAATVGSRRFFVLLRDFLPLLALVTVFTYLRGIADDLGMPTWWQPQLGAEKFLFFGHVPTLWLQEHLKYATPQWWDVPVALVYMSFFVLPSVTAAVLWWRNRRNFYQWSTRYVSLSFLCFGVFALAPSAPPWAAARCTAGDLAGHPAAPNCMASRAQLPGGGLIGLAAHPRRGAKPWIDRITLDGLSEIHLSVARLWRSKTALSLDPVASFPSLHAGTALLFTMFMWHHVRRSIRIVLALYPAAMLFALVYSGEHYVVDCLAGFAAAVLITLVLSRVERRVAARGQGGIAGPVPESAA